VVTEGQVENCGVQELRCLGGWGCLEWGEGLDLGGRPEEDRGNGGWRGGRRGQMVGGVERVPMGGCSMVVG
jgi:hypothetical protein